MFKLMFQPLATALPLLDESDLSDAVGLLRPVPVVSHGESFLAVAVELSRVLSGESVSFQCDEGPAEHGALFIECFVESEVAQ